MTWRGEVRKETSITREHKGSVFEARALGESADWDVDTRSLELGARNLKVKARARCVGEKSPLERLRRQRAWCLWGEPALWVQTKLDAAPAAMLERSATSRRDCVLE